MRVHQQGVFGLDQRPGFAHEGGDGLADGQVDPLDEGSLDAAGEADRLEFSDQGFALAPEHASDGIGQLATTAAFDQLAVQELLIDLPVVGVAPRWAEPGTEVNGDSGHRMA